MAALRYIQPYVPLASGAGTVRSIQLRCTAHTTFWQGVQIGLLCSIFGPRTAFKCWGFRKSEICCHVTRARTVVFVINRGIANGYTPA